MRYTLITTKGKIRRFYLLSVAILYQSIDGGVIFDEAIMGTERLDKIPVEV